MRNNRRNAAEELELADLQLSLNEACVHGREAALRGKVATYIPELGKADPSLVGIAACTLDGRVYASGNADVPFTLQSISKVFALTVLMAGKGEDAVEGMPCEPSGDTFHSIVRLEEEKGHPRNPLINAGAILVSSRLPGNDVEQKVRTIQSLLSMICGEDVAVDEDVYGSESRTGYRNRALANYMQHFGMLGNVRVACDTYFRQCALVVDARSLARAGLYLANRGVEPVSETKILSPSCNQTILAIMATCGLYDQVGAFAISVGLPAKSAVSGAILAIVPGQLSVAAYGPALGPKGNSVAGMAMLKYLSQELRLSLYD